jgi:pantothenate kinase
MSSGDGIDPSNITDGASIDAIVRFFYRTLIDSIDLCSKTINTSGSKVLEKWKKHIEEELKKARKKLEEANKNGNGNENENENEKEEITVTDPMALAFWFYNTLVNMGVKASLKPNEATIMYIPEYLDEEITKTTLQICASAIALQHLEPN